MRKIFYLLVAIFPLFLNAQNRSIKTGDFEVPYTANWDLRFPGTYHYYYGPEDNIVWHGQAIVNSNKTNSDRVYNYGVSVSYTDRRTLNVKANYKDGTLDGLFTLKHVINFKATGDVSSTIAGTFTLTAHHKEGVPDGQWKFDINATLDGKNGVYNSQVTYKDGAVVKFDATESAAGEKQSEYHLTMDDNQYVINGTAFNSDIDITIKNGLASDRLILIDSYSEYQTPNAEQQKIIENYQNGIFNEDSLLDRGFIFVERSISDINNTFIENLFDEGYVNYDWWTGGNSRIGTLTVHYKVLQQIELTSFARYKDRMTNLSRNELKHLIAAMDSTGRYNDCYLTSKTRKEIQEYAVVLINKINTGIQNRNKDALLSLILQNLHNQPVELKDVRYDEDNNITYVSFKTDCPYNTGVGFFTKVCVINDVAIKYISEQVSKAFDHGETVENEWASVQTPYRNTLQRNEQMLSMIDGKIFSGLKNSYLEDYNTRLTALDKNNPSVAKDNLDSIHSMMDRYTNLWRNVQQKYNEILQQDKRVHSIVDDASFVEINQAYSTNFNNLKNAINSSPAESVMQTLSFVLSRQQSYYQLAELKRQILSNNDMIANQDNKQAKHILEVYNAYYQTLNLVFDSPDRINEMQNIIDIQNQIITALRSEKIKEYDKRVKKAKDPTIYTVIQLIND
ncbi:MAG: hypothetical protein J5848_00545 [Bacteroidales bacterium]|nr:hypothetical protein [Bacteroidales bacterium]